MAIKKSELYSSLWASCDELRGGMDASQYKDYVLVFLFLKYISDKYADQPFAPIQIPSGAAFRDLSALKGSKDIGDQINKAIIAPLVAANQELSLSDFPDFNDATKLGSGREMVDRLTNLIAIFEGPALDFSKNRAEGDDILGDAYEYLMRHFATESGKSKGQFYTPAEVSRIMAKVLGIGGAPTSAETTVYDPTCGSGSLLLKVADEARTPITLYGQEKDSATSGLARMNMILHNNPTAEIAQGNTLADPKFLDGSSLKTFDYVVANPPFSDKRWSTGVETAEDPHERFRHFGTPPDKQGDYAYLLHILRSLRPATTRGHGGKGACILPHGVLFRGNAEAVIRKNLIRKGYLKAIIGLPANLFYGTGIPACIIVLDKADALARKGIFMIDASNGYIKDGNKNRLRSRDIHQIVDAYQKGVEVPGYARPVSFEEIEKNDYNLNLPRYIDNRAAEDLQDIEAHLRGGIPQRDVAALQNYWDICPNLRKSIFAPLREGYVQLAGDDPLTTLNAQLTTHPDLVAFTKKAKAHLAQWQKRTSAELKARAQSENPKALIHEHSEALLAHYKGTALIDPYAVYQHLMDYWAETMQDDAYQIALDGWVAKTRRLLETKKGAKGKADKTIDKGWTCDLIPKDFIVARYFAKEQAAINTLTAKLEATTASLTELEEEHSGEDGPFADFEKINQGAVKARLKEIKAEPAAKAAPALKVAESPAGYGKKDATSSDPQSSLSEDEVLESWLDLHQTAATLKKKIKSAEDSLDLLAYQHYPQLSEADIQSLVVDDKWLATLATRIHSEFDRITQNLTQRVRALADRYDAPLPAITTRAAELEAKVHAHLERMGFSTN